MRQRIKVAAALVHEPTVVVLDEPLNGLDPRQRLRMIDLFRQLGDEGRTVIVSSHVLDEVERFGSRILMIADGRLAAEGDFHAIRALMDDRPHRLRVLATPARALASALIGTAGVVGVQLDDDVTIVVDVHDVTAFRTRVLPLSVDVGARVTEIAPLDESLESVFRYLVSRRS
jgi:ABC-2 type transport system ATP-binding protein